MLAFGCQLNGKQSFNGLILLIFAAIRNTVPASAGDESSTASEKKTNLFPSQDEREAKASFMKVVTDHQGIIFKISHIYCDTKEDREDLYQEIIFQLWKGYTSFNNRSAISTWIHAVAMRIAGTPFKRQRTKIEFHGELPERPAEEQPMEAEEKLYRFFHSIRERDRGIVALLVEGYTQKEIAAIAGLREEAVRQRLSRLRRNIKNSQHEV